MFRFVVWKSLFHLTRKTSYRAEARVRAFGMRVSFRAAEKIPSLPSSLPRAQPGIQVVLISATVIFVVAGTRVAMPLSPPTRNNYFRRRPRARLNVHEIRFPVWHSRTHTHTHTFISWNWASLSLQLYRLDYQEYAAFGFLFLSLCKLNYEYSRKSCGISNATAMRFTYHVLL